MQETELRNNSIFTFIKLLLFLFILCFLVGITATFWRETRTREGFNLNILVFSVLALFCFYVFFADLNVFYKRIQKFFFKNDLVSYIFPSILILLILGYFFVPKIVSVSINKDLFVFLGGFSITCHLVYVARETRGQTFTAMINYLFIFSILFILHLFILSLYFNIFFNMHLGKIVVEGIKGGAALIQSIFASFS